MAFVAVVVGRLLRSWVGLLLFIRSTLFGRCYLYEWRRGRGLHFSADIRRACSFFAVVVVMVMTMTAVVAMLFMVVTALTFRVF